MKWGGAFLAGSIGGAAMTTIMAVARTLGMRFHFEMMLGTSFGGQPGIRKWAIGLVMHLALSGSIALLYALGFEHATHRAGWLVGAAFAAVHTSIAGIVMGFVPALNPAVPEIMPAPGPFMTNNGGAHVIVFVLLHVVYGALVGATYGPVRIPAHSD